MNKYIVEQRIETLAENAIRVDKNYPKFTLDEVELSQWDFNHRDGWTSYYWLARSNIYALNYKDAYNEFGRKLAKIVPRLALVAQCYTRSVVQPFLITREEHDYGYLYHVIDREPVGLMFEEHERRALELILRQKDLNNDFFLYWEDAINTLGYAAKLLLMFSALEALSKKNKWKIIVDILGEDLKEIIFKRNSGLRQRLVHGEYLKDEDLKENYVEIIHKKVIQYFNTEILKENLITEDIKGPQRHIFDNKLQGKIFIEPKDKTITLDLKTVVDDFNKHSWSKSKKFNLLHDASLEDTF